MGNTSKKNFYPISGTVAGDLYNDAKNSLTTLQNTKPPKIYSRGDFTQEELDGILSDLQVKYPNKKFLFKPRGA